MNLPDILYGYNLVPNSTQQSIESAVLTNHPASSMFIIFLALFASWFIYFLIKFFKPSAIKIHFTVVVNRISKECKRLLQQKEITSELNELVSATVDYDTLAFPYPVSLHYIRNADKQTAYLYRNKVHVKLKQSENEDINFIHAIAMYVERGFIPNGKLLLTPILARASNVLMVRKIIEVANKRGLAYFMSYFFNEYLQGDQDVYNLYCLLMDIDKKSLFLPVLVKQAERITRIIEYPEYSYTLKSDFQEFMHCLIHIASSRNILSTNTTIYNTYFRVAFLSFHHLSGSYGTRQILEQILTYKKQGFSYIYLLSISNDPFIINEVLSELHYLDKSFSSIAITKNRIIQYHRYAKQTICIEFSVFFNNDDPM